MTNGLFFITTTENPSVYAAFRRISLYFNELGEKFFNLSPTPFGDSGGVEFHFWLILLSVCKLRGLDFAHSCYLVAQMYHDFCRFFLYFFLIIFGSIFNKT